LENQSATQISIHFGGVRPHAAAHAGCLASRIVSTILAGENAGIILHFEAVLVQRVFFSIQPQGSIRIALLGVGHVVRRFVLFGTVQGASPKLGFTACVNGA
jgi:hypothetical protein